MTRKLLLIGKVVGIHGVRGYLKVKFWGEYEDKTWKRVFISAGDEKRVFAVEDIKFHKGFLLLKLKDIYEREEMLKFKGSDVFLDKKDLPRLPNGDFYWFELEGLKVYTEEGNFLGAVEKILSTGSNDIFVVKEGEKEYLIPGIKDVVVSINKRAKKMVIRPVEGLI